MVFTTDALLSSLLLPLLSSMATNLHMIRTNENACPISVFSDEKPGFISFFCSIVLSLSEVVNLVVS